MDELYKIRLIVLLETAPQSNKYRQFAFTPKQYEQLRFFIASTGEKSGIKEPLSGVEMLRHRLEPEEIKLPSEIKDVFPKNN